MHSAVNGKVGGSSPSWGAIQGIIMLKIIALFAVSLLLLVSCGKMDQMEAHYTGYSKICVNGVLYYQFTSGATPAYTIDGKLIPCK